MNRSRAGIFSVNIVQHYSVSVLRRVWKHLVDDCVARSKIEMI